MNNKNLTSNSKKYTMEMLQEDFNKAKQELLQLNNKVITESLESNEYELKLDSKLEVLGRCQVSVSLGLKNTNSGTLIIRKYDITINKMYADVSDRKYIQDTVMHELLHTLPNCMNHQAPWKAVASIVNIRYGYNIQRLADNSKTIEYREKQIQMGVYKYKVTCLGCKNEILFQKESNTLSDIKGSIRCGIKSSCNCRKCKGREWKIERIG